MQTVCQDGSTVGALEESAMLQSLEISPDGDLGDPEEFGQRGNAHDSTLPKELLDTPMAFRRKRLLHALDVPPCPCAGSASGPASLTEPERVCSFSLGNASGGEETSAERAGDVLT